MGVNEKDKKDQLTGTQLMRKHTRKFFSRIIKDFKQKELLPLKLLFFINASTLFVLYPYLTVHMRELGINVEETAIMSAITPIISIIMPPLAGMVADKIGNFKIILSLLSAVGGLASLLLLAVPIGRITVTYPEQIMFSIGCGDFNNSHSAINPFLLRLSEEYPCNTSGLLTSEESFLTTKLETCGVLCQSSYDKSDIPEEFRHGSSEEDETELSVDSILYARSYGIRIEENGQITSSFKFNLTEDNVWHKTTKQDALSNRFMKNNGNFLTSIRRLSKSHYFLPTGNVYQLECTPEEDASATSEFLLSSRFSRMKREVPSYNCAVRQSSDSSDALTSDPSTIIETWLNKESKFYKPKTLRWNATTIEPTCNQEHSETISASAYLHNPKNHEEVVHEIKLNSCEPRCLMTASRKNVCVNQEKNIEFSPVLTFWSYFAVRVFIGIIGGTVFAMFEGAVIAVLRENSADYGLQRIYGAIGGMISSPLSGLLIEYFSEGKGYTDFRPAFYLYAALKVVCGALMLLMNLEFKTASDNVVSDVIAVVKKVEVIALMVASFVLAIAWGYLESFLFWFLQDLGGKGALMGITITVGGLAGIPLLALSGPIINKFGHANVIVVGFIFYAIRLLGYSLITNPWHCLIFEVMECITSGLAWTATVTYAAKLSTPTTDSSIQGLIGGIYFGVGKGAGSLIGGFLMKAFGARPTYQIIGVFTVTMGAIYFFFNKFYLKTRPPQVYNDIVKKPPKRRKSSILEILTFRGGKDKDKNPKDTTITCVEQNPDPASAEPGTVDVVSHDNPAFTLDENVKTDQPASEAKEEENVTETTNK